MTDRMKHRFQGQLRNWLRLLAEMRLISEQEAADAADRAAADAATRDGESV